MQPTSRQAYLDWLRIFAIIGVLFFHAAMPFAAEEPWHIKNSQTSNVLLEFNFMLSRFRMHLLFFISGAVTYFMMQKRSAGSFIGLRFRRLFLPLLFGMLIIVPPQVYMERLAQGYTGSYLEFYPSIFRGEAYPKGNTSWHHLWFIAYLFVYDLLAAPLFAWMMSVKGKLAMKKLDWFGKGQRFYLLAIPGTIVFTSLVLDYPETNDLIHDVAYLPYWFLFLLTGFICISSPAIMNSIERNRRLSLSVGILLMIALNYSRWNGLEPWDTNPQGWRSDAMTYVYLSFYPLVAWAWVLALTGYGKRYLNRATAFSNYASQSVYPFYIIHQTVIVILAYYIVQAPEGVMSKYVFLAGLSLLLSVAICHLFIQPFRLTRFMFGLKPPKQELPGRKMKTADEIPASKAELQMM